MIFNISLHSITEGATIPINYQYPLSSAIYNILSKGDAEYSQFLHEKGYGKGYKFFTFSDLKFRYKRVGDRMLILDDSVSLKVCFHLPEASQKFVEGLFRSETIVIADKKSRAEFVMQSIIAETNPLNDITDSKEIIQVVVRAESPIVAGSKKEDGKYDFKSPDDSEFVTCLIYSWREKISAAYDYDTGLNAILIVEVEFYNNPYRSRLVHIKDGTTASTQIRGYLNFKLKLTAEKRFVELILNAGLGLYSAQGMGCVGVVEVEEKKRNNETKIQ